MSIWLVWNQDKTTHELISCHCLIFFFYSSDVACTHVTNTHVKITTDDTSCNGKSIYACDTLYKQVAGNTERVCGFGSILSGYPLVCSGDILFSTILSRIFFSSVTTHDDVYSISFFIKHTHIHFSFTLASTCKLDILFIIEASAHTSSIHSSLMSAIGDLVGTLKISTNDIQVGVITYDDVVDQNIEFNDFSSSASSLDSAITSITIPSASSTVNLADALRFGFYKFFTLSNGNRFTSFRHFVLVAKTYSSQTGSVVADHIRLNLRNQIFTIGIWKET